MTKALAGQQSMRNALLCASALQVIMNLKSKEEKASRFLKRSADADTVHRSTDNDTDTDTGHIRTDNR